jgi:hypothetical protein
MKDNAKQLACAQCGAGVCGPATYHFCGERCERRYERDLVGFTRNYNERGVDNRVPKTNRRRSARKGDKSS